MCAFIAVLLSHNFASPVVNCLLCRAVNYSFKLYRKLKAFSYKGLKGRQIKIFLYRIQIYKSKNIQSRTVNIP